MTMPVFSSSITPLSRLHQEERFGILLETHLDWISRHAETRVLGIDKGIANKFNGDLFSYLSALNIPREIHYAILRLNRMTSPTDFNDQIDNLVVPSVKAIEDLKVLYKTMRAQIGRK